MDDCKLCASLQTASPLWSDGLWHLRPIDPPWGVAGWLLLISQRHCPGPAHFTAEEERTFGSVLARCSRALERATGALRIYTAALGESQHHLHVHLVPRYASMPLGATGWNVFDLARAAAAGEISPADPLACAHVHALVADALARRADIRDVPEEPARRRPRA
ncbi:MAG TPA: HIT domain-containing protein [Kofleriaceae bacterium]|jgi:diadenosine tetraphosphate (Ap4A) HIT family hydrolase